MDYLCTIAHTFNVGLNDKPVTKLQHVTCPTRRDAERMVEALGMHGLDCEAFVSVRFYRRGNSPVILAFDDVNDILNQMTDSHDGGRSRGKPSYADRPRTNGAAHQDDMTA